MTNPGAIDLQARYGVNLLGFALLVVMGAFVWEGLADRVVIAIPMLAIAVLIGGVAPGAGVAGVLAAAPTMYQLHPMPRGEFSLLELAILVFVVGTALRLALSLARRDGDPWHALVTPVHLVVPVILILVATGIAVMMVADSSRRDISLREARTVILEPIMFLGAARIALRNPAHRTFAASALVGVGAIVALFAVFQVVFDAGVVRAGDVLRATGPYTHPNNLSFFLERTFLLTCAVAVARPRWWGLWVLVLVQAAGLGLTWSRGAWLATALGVAVLLLLQGSTGGWPLSVSPASSRSRGRFSLLPIDSWTPEAPVPSPRDLRSGEHHSEWRGIIRFSASAPISSSINTGGDMWSRWGGPSDTRRIPIT